jgi:hypothetical protein
MKCIFVIGRILTLFDTLVRDIDKIDSLRGALTIG